MRNLLLLVSLLFIGCASTSKAPMDQSDAAKNFEIPQGKGVVYLYRPGRMLNAASQTPIKVNGIDAGGTGPGTFFRWELTPGTYAFSCNTKESSAIVELNVEENSHYFLRQDERVGVTSGRVTLREVDEKEGKKAVKKHKLLLSTYRQ